jgi:hypothetical protein
LTKWRASGFECGKKSGGPPDFDVVKKWRASRFDEAKKWRASRFQCGQKVEGLRILLSIDLGTNIFINSLFLCD